VTNLKNYFPLTLENVWTRPCRRSFMIDGEAENLFIKTDKLSCGGADCGVVIYRSRKLHLMEDEEKRAFRANNFNRKQGQECPTIEASSIRNSTTDVGLIVATHCTKVEVIVDSRDSLDQSLGYDCYVKIQDPAALKSIDAKGF
ncbi:hypothetical protein PMAYCL1PPCAC_12910, partial [Pristionchus mayeri]